MGGHVVLDEFAGVIGRPLGNDGTMSIADAPPQSFSILPGMAIGIGYSREFVDVYHVRAYAEHGSRRRIALQEVTTSDQASSLAERAIYVASAAAADSASERYAVGDLLECTVLDVHGNHIGTITDVWLLPANDVWEVTTPTGASIPLPVIDDVIVAVDIQSKTVTVRMMEGLDGLSNSPQADEHDA